MTIETIELRGERFVILPEKDFLELQRRIGVAVSELPPSVGSRFREVVPIELDGVAASELLVRERR